MDLLAYALVALFTLLTVLLLAAVTNRLIGIRLGPVRTLPAGVLAVVLSARCSR